MASEFPPKVDDEIDAFAENAFDALMVDDEKKKVAKAAKDDYEDVELDDVMMVSEAPSEAPSDAQTSAKDAQLARLQAEIGELKAKLAETAGGVSSREFLDLREALNSKDKEILDLRDQMTSRDKQLLSMRDENLVLERARADYDEKTAGIELALHKAQGSIEGLTADKDTASKRYEDVKTRFERADERVRQLEAEISEEKDVRAREVAALKAGQEEELNRAAANHDTNLATAKAEAAALLETAQEDHATAIQAAATDKETALASLRSELDDLHTAALSRATSEADAAKEAGLATLREELEQATAVQMSHAAAISQKMLSEREVELKTEKKLEIEELEKDHSKQLATLGRKLSDTETELAGVRERERLGGERVEELETQVLELETQITGLESRLSVRDTELEDTRQLHQDVRTELSGTRESRDRIQLELDNTLGDVETLSGANKEYESRIGSLGAVQSQLESRLGNAREKIASDDALLDRVRKAMAIGMGLLEEQRNTPLVQDDLADDVEELGDDVSLEVVDDAD